MPELKTKLKEYRAKLDMKQGDLEIGRAHV